MSLRKLIPLLALALLAGCERTGRAAPGICTPFPQAPPPAAPGAATPATDFAAALDDCLHRWGYTLAVSSDRAGEVAQATVAACAPALIRWNQQALAAAPAAAQGGGGGEPAPSLLTGQLTTPPAEHHAYAQARALFYVVQARAGHCPAPPMSPPAAR
jgi:hypothetical protein